MKRIYEKCRRIILFTFMLFGVCFAFFQTTLVAEAAYNTGWPEDLAAWQSYGNNGWEVTGSEVPKWSGTNAAANQNGDPATNPLAIPLAQPAEQVEYYQMNQMGDGSWRLELPQKATADVVYYDIYSPEQLRYAMANGYNIRLMSDLDMRGQDNISWSAVSFSRQTFLDGNGHTIYNLRGGSLVGSWSQPLIVKNLTVSSAYLSGGILGSSMNNTYISMEDVALEHAVVSGSGHIGGLVNNAYYRRSGSNARVYANRCHTKNVYVMSNSCSGNIFGPISGWVENCYAIDGTMRTQAHSGAFTSCAGNYVIQNCFTNVQAYADNNTGAFVGHVEDSLYTPGGDGVTKFINCYASGSVEGSTNLGGFCAGAGICSDYPCKYLFENCYSTAMVGMQANGNYQGGFLGCQEANATSTFRNCYAAGEVGALGTDLGNTSLPMGGFIGGSTGGSIDMDHCYYDKQTTAMKEKAGACAAAGSDVAAGLLTQQLMKTLPDGKPAGESDWVLADGTYPQLKIFTNNQTFAQADKNTADAYSKASVCTAILYPSNLSEDEFGAVDQTDYDTVRSLRFLFPLTNNTLANTTDGSYDISWTSDGAKCGVDGMEDAQIVVVKSSDEKNPADDYSVVSLAPGVGMVSVQVERNGVVGQRRLRLVPTSAITVTQDDKKDVTSGLDASIYAVPKGETVEERVSINYLTFKEVTYDHRIGMFFASGNSMGQNVQKQGLEGVEQNTPEQFARVDLAAQPGGVVVTKVQKKMADGSRKDLEVTQELLDLFTGKTAAQSSDIGEYYFIYRWYLNKDNVGASSGYLETSKKLTVLPAVTPQFYRNYDDKDTVCLPLPENSIPMGQKALYYKNGDPIGILPEEPERHGYTFQGWALQKDTLTRDGIQMVKADTKINTDWANEQYVVPIYAVWKPNPWTIHIEDLPKGKTEDVDVVFDSNVEEELEPHEPEQNGRVFLGWTTEPGGDVVNVDEAIRMSNGDLTVYPVWQAMPTIDKQAENLDRENVTFVGDTIRYTITVKNTQSHSIWKGAEITDKLPKGLEFCAGSAVLTGPDGNKTNLSDRVYDEENHTITYKLGDVSGQATYVLQFEAKVGPQAIDRNNPENENITNVAAATGKNPDGSENLPRTPEELEKLDKEDPDNPDNPDNPNNPDQPKEPDGTSSAAPEGGLSVVPIDPDGYVKKTAENQTDPNGQTQVGDRIIYRITVGNRAEGSLWMDVDVQDQLPAGIRLEIDSLTLLRPDGTSEKLGAGVYQSESRTIHVSLGDIYGGEAYVLSFEVVVLPEAVGMDIGNMAWVTGGKPSDYDDWSKREEEEPKSEPTTIETGTPVYPSPLDKPDSSGTKGGVLLGDAKAQLEKHVKNLNHEDGTTYLNDWLQYDITLTNAVPGTLLQEAVLVDHLPSALELNTTTLLLKRADGNKIFLDESVYDEKTRTITVPIGQLASGETYVLTYKARVTLKDWSGKAEPIVNRVELTGKNPDGAIHKSTPAAEAKSSFPVDVVVGNGAKTGDGTQIGVYLMLCAVSGVAAIGVWYRKRRSR